MEADSLGPQQILQLLVLRGRECLKDGRQLGFVGRDEPEDGLVECLELVNPVDRRLE